MLHALPNQPDFKTLKDVAYSSHSSTTPDKVHQQKRYMRISINLHQFHTLSGAAWKRSDFCIHENFLSTMLADKTASYSFWRNPITSSLKGLVATFTKTLARLATSSGVTSSLFKQKKVFACYDLSSGAERKPIDNKSARLFLCDQTKR